MCRVYIREAIVCLVIARIAVLFLPPKLLLSWASRPPRHIRRFSGHEIEWVSWAVDAAGSKRWIGAVCFPRALVAQTMLRRRGIPSRLCLGVAHKGVVLTAHAWVEIGPSIIVGGAERDRFIKLQEFGPGASSQRVSDV
jgi:hypothetical protein